MAIFEGAGVALVTPMNENLEVNYDKLEELLEEQIAGGTDAIVICGTTGESATLTEEEHMRTIRFAIDKVNHRIPVVCLLYTSKISDAYTKMNIEQNMDIFFRNFEAKLCRQ